MSYYNPNDYMASSAGASSAPSAGMYGNNDLQFQDFSQNYAANGAQQPGYATAQPASTFGGGMTYGNTNAYDGTMFGGSMNAQSSASGYSFDDEPPLLEGMHHNISTELEINLEQIKHKAVMAINPFKPGEANLMDDTDLAGPLLFCMMYGGFLLLSGKMSFSYVYGVALVGCLALFALLNLMTEKGVSLTCVCSVLGYCLLPMVLLSSIAILASLKGVVGFVLTGISIMWCTVSAAKMFVHVLQSQDQRLLIGYPCMLLYGVFALMTVF